MCPRPGPPPADRRGRPAGGRHRVTSPRRTRSCPTSGAAPRHRDVAQSAQERPEVPFGIPAAGQASSLLEDVTRAEVSGQRPRHRGRDPVQRQHDQAPAARILRGMPRLVREQARAAREGSMVEPRHQDVPQAERGGPGYRQLVAGTGQQPIAGRAQSRAASAGHHDARQRRAVKGVGRQPQSVPGVHRAPPSPSCPRSRRVHLLAVSRRDWRA